MTLVDKEGAGAGSPEAASPREILSDRNRTLPPEGAGGRPASLDNPGSRTPHADLIIETNHAVHHRQPPPRKGVADPCQPTDPPPPPGPDRPLPGAPGQAAIRLDREPSGAPSPRRRGPGGR